MKPKRKSLVKWSGIVVRCLLSLLVFQSCLGGGAVIQSEAKTGVTEREVVEFVTAYYKAHTPKDIDTLVNYMGDVERQEMEEYLIQYRVLFECGFQGYQNIDVVAYPLSDGIYWVAYVSYDMAVEGFDVALPGLNVDLVGSDKDGKLWIANYSEAAEDALEDLAEEIRKRSLSDEIVDRSNEVNRRYNEILAEAAEFVEWLESAHEVILEEKSKVSLKQEEAEETPKEKTAGKEKSYVVKKGDCLWDIAEEQLGDGMLWSGLYERNKDVIGDDPDLLYVGTTLQLN